MSSTNLTATFIFSGMSDYWGGTHDRGEGRGCAFAHYNRETTVRDLVDQWVEDFWTNDYDFGGCPDSVNEIDIRDCILESFTDLGRADYASGAICEFSDEYVDCNDLNQCVSCGESLGELHCDDCDNADTALVEIEHCPDDDVCGESPVAIMLIEWADHPDYNKE